MITDFRLKVFKTVADRLSFTRAARELFISQPAVTKQIGELEKQLGTNLFLRQGNRIALTPQGERLLAYANRILSLYGELGDEFADRTAPPEGELRLGASTTIAQYVLPGLLARFRKRYPGIALQVESGNTQYIERAVQEARIDFGIIEGMASVATLHYEPFMLDELVLVTATSNTGFRREEIRSAELPEYPLVIRESGSGTLDVIEKALATRGLSLKKLRIDMQWGSTESIKRYLLASDSLAFLSVHAILDELTRGQLRVVEVSDLSIERRFHFVSMHGRTGRLCELFKQFCRWSNGA